MRPIAILYENEAWIARWLLERTRAGRSEVVVA